VNTRRGFFLKLVACVRGARDRQSLIAMADQEAARRPPSTPGLSRRSGRIPALPYPPIKPLHCTAIADMHKRKIIHSGRKQR
jgi:hypothetical protein